MYSLAHLFTVLVARHHFLSPREVGSLYLCNSPVLVAGWPLGQSGPGPLSPLGNSDGESVTLIMLMMPTVHSQRRREDPQGVCIAVLT
ncbi:hypothetical protein AB1N83_003929 [Pleurotus pulmonarius]